MSAPRLPWGWLAGTVAAVVVALAVLQWWAAVPLVLVLTLQLVVLAPSPARAAGWVRTGWRSLAALLGWAVIVAALDAGLGLAIDVARGEDDLATDDSSVALRDQDLPPTTDPRVDAPGYAGQTWPERYFQELDSLDFTYVPFVGPRMVEAHGQTIDSADGIRASWTPPDVGDAPVVWFFGGSTLWGEGQRDDHTIPSEVARLADAAGTPIRAVNFGERGYTAFAEWLLFEQELARRGPPDLAVFYHGINETFSLLEDDDNFGPQPSIFQIDVTTDAFHLAPPLPGAGPVEEPSLAKAYRDRSAVLRLLDEVADLGLATPAGAGPVEDTRRQIQAIELAAEIYRRSIDLIRWSARRSGLEPVILLQPHVPTNLGYQEFADRVADLGIDLSDAFADAPSSIFIDGAHTTEDGARLAAEAVWTELAPIVADRS